jgi:hypothetical protein
MTETPLAIMQEGAELARILTQITQSPLLTIPTATSLSRATDLNFCMTTWAFSRLNTMMQRISTERMLKHRTSKK